jgi:hypothetical protein
MFSSSSNGNGKGLLIGTPPSSFSKHTTGRSRPIRCHTRVMPEPPSKLPSLSTAKKEANRGHKISEFRSWHGVYDERVCLRGFVGNGGFSLLTIADSCPETTNPRPPCEGADEGLASGGGPQGDEPSEKGKSHDFRPKNSNNLQSNFLKIGKRGIIECWISGGIVMVSLGNDNDHPLP